MKHYLTFLKLKGLLEEFRVWIKEQRRLSHNESMKKYRKSTPSK